MDKKELYKNMFVPLKGKLKKYDFVGFDIETNIRDDGLKISILVDYFGILIIRLLKLIFLRVSILFTMIRKFQK